MMLVCALSAPAFADNAFSTWERLRHPDTASIRFAEGYAFLRAHPGWPQEKLIRIRSEAAALNDRPARNVMDAFCTDFPPISGRGMIACARDTGMAEDAQTSLIRQGWVQGDFSEDEEERILHSYGERLRAQDHLARSERLLYEGKAPAAKRMRARLDADAQRVMDVRLAFITRDARAPSLLATLTQAQRQTPGILFERLRYRMRQGDGDLAELLLLAPNDVPYPDLWWPARLSAAREAMNRRDYTDALELLEHHGDLKPEALAEALWLRGWILLRHRKDAAQAYTLFHRLYTSVTTPVSKARAAYWAARAAEANGNSEIAREWLEKAARHPTVFYGQLAIAKHAGDAPLSLPAAPSIGEAERQAFARDPLVLATRHALRSEDDEVRDLFMIALAQHFSSPAQLALFAQMAQKEGGTALGVEAAKLAMRNAVTLIEQGWPRLSLPKNLPIEAALTLAITRQESEFDPNAKSTANARGLMQLLPSTAREVAKRTGLSYSPKMITDPTTNLTLGSRYLGRRIADFNGSYILAIASYNAGIGNVRKWVAANGAPPQTTDGVIDWIESIPFAETRTYVMRVLENLQVYRAQLDPDARLALEKDLLR